MSSTVDKGGEEPPRSSTGTDAVATSSSSSTSNGDDVQLEQMYEWLTKKSEILPSVARSYCKLFVDQNISTVKRLGKRIARNNDFLSSLGINQDDEFEILDVLSQEGLYTKPSNQSVGWGGSVVDHNSSSSSSSGGGLNKEAYLEDNINEFLKKQNEIEHEQQETSTKEDSDNDSGNDDNMSERLGSPISKRVESDDDFASYSYSGSQHEETKNVDGDDYGNGNGVDDGDRDDYKIIDSIQANKPFSNSATLATSDSQEEIISLLTDSKKEKEQRSREGSEVESKITRERMGSKRSHSGSQQGDSAAPSSSAAGGGAPTSTSSAAHGMIRDRAGSVISRERAASTLHYFERKQRSSPAFKKIVAVEKKEAFQDLIKQANDRIDSLLTAMEANMEAAVLGELTNILGFVELSLDRQRALYRANTIHTVLQGLLLQMGQSAKICERSMQLVAVCCRHSDDDKSSTSHELARAFGQADMCKLIKKIFEVHASVLPVVAALCDAVRCLCCLDSNRTRFLDLDLCESMAQGLTNYMKNGEICGWMCRAIGHLCASSEEAREKVGSSACVFITEILSEHQNNVSVCVEACWAIRNIAHMNENNINSFYNEHAHVILASIYRVHFENEVFAKECCRAFSSLIKNEEDDILQNIVDTGVVDYIFRSLKRFDDSELLAQYAFELMFLLSCNQHLCTRLVQMNILKYLSCTIDCFAGGEWVSIWSLRCLAKLTVVDGVSDRISDLGLCEHTIAAVQRLVKSPSVCKFGCLTMGLIAKESIENSQRLSDAGACEVCIMALNRHDTFQDTAENICTSIHWLAHSNSNNLQWLGANGACEAVISIIKKHIPSLNVYLIKEACLALGTMAYNEDGNILKFKAAGVSETIAAAVRKYGAESDVTVQICRAIYALCYESSLVSELGKNNICALMVSVLNAHQNDAAVTEQACYSISALAVKTKSDAVHNANTKKLVSKGAIQSVVNAMGKADFEDNADVQRSTAMAVASLGRLPANNKKLGELGACELILKAFGNFFSNKSVAGKLAVAVTVLCTDNPDHLAVFCGDEERHVVDYILDAFSMHDNDLIATTEFIRALIAVASDKAAFKKIKSDSAVKQITKVMRTHEADARLNFYACRLISLIAADLNTVARIIAYRGCDAITIALHKHHDDSIHGKSIVEWSAKCIVHLCKNQASQVAKKFDNADTCSALSVSLKKYDEDALLVECISAAIVCIASVPDSRERLGQMDCCANLQCAIQKHQKNGVVSGLICEAVFEMCGSLANRNAFGSAGTVETVVSVLFTHVSTLQVATQCCKSIAALCRKSDISNASKAMAVDVAHAFLEVLRIHFAAGAASQWASAAIAAVAIDTPEFSARLCDINLSFENYKFRDMLVNGAAAAGVIAAEDIPSLLVKVMKKHRPNADVVHQALRAAKNLSTDRPIIASRFSSLGIFKCGIAYLKTYGIDAEPSEMNNNIIDLSGWILTHCSASSHPDIYIMQSPDGKNPYLEFVIKILHSTRHRDTALQRFSTAVSAFMRNMKKPYFSACDAVMDGISMTVTSNRPLATQAACLEAIYDLALSHPANAKHFLDSDHFKTIETFIARTAKRGHSKDVEDLAIALFRAIHAIVTGNPQANQDKVSTSQVTLKSIIKIFYNDMEFSGISMNACLVIGSIVKNNRDAQNRLSVVCDFIVDVLSTHAKDKEVLVHALSAISSLCHENDFNRKKLAAAGTCEAVVTVMKTHLDSWPDLRVLYWSVRCVGDLAANNYANQVRFSKTACANYLVSITKKQTAMFTNPAGFSSNSSNSSSNSNSISGISGNDITSSAAIVDIALNRSPESQNQSKDMLNWCLWACANLVQKPPPRENKQPNFTKLDELNIVETVMGVVSAVSARKGESLSNEECVNTFVWAVRLMLNLSRNPHVKAKFLASHAESAIASTLDVLTSTVSLNQSNEPSLPNEQEYQARELVRLTSKILQITVVKREGSAPSAGNDKDDEAKNEA